ncbi:hypothetical protein JX266_002204 [Neoarthrinium moseri]|nr:hypothetical protein JX266_002204 [Neoarthrinium moseri]
MSHEGGDLNQMAKDGTTSVFPLPIYDCTGLIGAITVPGDAGKMNTIPSVASPHQTQKTAGGLGAMVMSEAADNPVSDEKTVNLASGVGEGITGTGDSLPASTTSKHSGHGGKR